MACRFPGAGSIERFWDNLTGGVESITFFSEEQLRAAGVPAADLADPRYVRARGISTAPRSSTPASSATARARRR